MRLVNKSTKRRNNESKFKNRSTFFKPNNFKSLKSLVYNKIIPDKIRKSHNESNETCLSFDKAMETD